MRLKFKYFAIDFDETITTDNTIHLGTTSVRDHAIRVINKIYDHGGKICINTCRTGSDEEMVKEFLDNHNIPYHVINDNFPEIKETFGGKSRKIFACVYIDDRDIHLKGNGLSIDWLEIEKLLFEVHNE